ncbi:dynamin family protein [Bacillus acidicola]
MIKESTTQKETISYVLQLVQHFKENGDTERAEKAESLLKKLHHGEFIVAFCGHFSAGKSTMINKLLGENVLPSSPIPTSANLVKVTKSNNNYAVIRYDKEQLLFKAPYDFKTVKDFCKNGNVKEIEIGKSQTDLPEGVTVMDTPGVDSTDDAHRIATESAIHLADIVFYVMDYNHVQSELNFMYTKDLLQHGVELYLIINQIDKHKEEELSFEDFESSVSESFASWNVYPKGIYYTSLKNPVHHSNQFDAVKKLMLTALMEKEERIIESARAAGNLLLKEHLKWLDEQLEMDSIPFEEVLSGYNEEEIAEITEKEEQIKLQLDKIDIREEKWTKQFTDELDKLVESAYLMPYQTRELAEAFLQSVQPEFKVGLLFGKKKTELERKERLDAFYHNVKTLVESQLDWHLREFAQKALRTANNTNSQLLKEAQTLSVPFNREMVTSTVKQNAMVTGEYILHYCDEIANQLKFSAKKACEEIKQAAANQIKARDSKEKQELERELKLVSEGSKALRELDHIRLIREKKEENLHDPLMDSHNLMQKYIDKWQDQEENRVIYSESMSAQLSEDKNESPLAPGEKRDQVFNLIPPDKMAANLQSAVQLLKDKHGFQRFAANLLEKAARLESRDFTIALFGAFSAGKSSFANALMGEKVLPVSPNPTTAAINRICPPNSVHKHRTAVVHLKSREQMMADVKHSLKVFGKECGDLASSLPLIQELAGSEEGDGRSKVHLSFLNAFAKGFSVFESVMGTNVETDIQGFQEFVANESKSCFVESIDLYFDSLLARQGITLVDTPGADSINARHTGVAFEYIKNSDAILFVTYYNHAFSKADREFLIQLGRVKDAFELDKMFFLVNAVDLAESEEELNDVLSYVRAQLSQYGIRFPRLFGVSSLLALEHPDRAPGMKDFKEAFHDFLEQDLTQMAVKSAEVELQRALQMVTAIIESGKESREEKERKASLLESQQMEMQKILHKAEPEWLAAGFQQELKELLFYVKQRVFYRFSDFFKEAFNPATLQKNDKSSLKQALEELLDSLGFDFSQELRATTVRLENHVNKLFQESFNQLSGEFSKLNEDITLSEFKTAALATPDFPKAFENQPRGNLESTFKYFKNARAFFEKNEKQLMQNELESLLKPMSDKYLEEQTFVLSNHFETFIHQEFSRMLGEMEADIYDQFQGWLSALTQTIDLNAWTEIKAQLGNSLNQGG